MKMIRPTCKACRSLAKAIDAYIAKAGNDLESELDKAGYTDAKGSIESAGELENDIKDILNEQTQELAEVVRESGSMENAKKDVSDYFTSDITGEVLSETFREYFTETIKTWSSDYIRETEGDLNIPKLRKRTTAWISEWSDQLASLMQLTSEQRMGQLLQQALDSNKGVDVFARTLADEGIRQEGYRARRAALTEMLRAHSVARQESIMQSPSADRKKWVHSGGHKNKPRENHVDIDGQIVPKDKPFELHGRDGGTYYPMYPRDPILPAAESINCHCTHVPVVNDDILGMSYEERQKLQQQIVEVDDREWEKELNEENMKRNVSNNIPEEREASRKYGSKYTKDTQIILSFAHLTFALLRFCFYLLVKHVTISLRVREWRKLLSSFFTLCTSSQPG